MPHKKIANPCTSTSCSSPVPIDTNTLIALFAQQCALLATQHTPGLADKILQLQEQFSAQHLHGQNPHTSHPSSLLSHIEALQGALDRCYTFITQSPHASYCKEDDCHCGKDALLFYLDSLEFNANKAP